MLALCGLFALQAPAVPAMAAETLTLQDQSFYRSDGTKIEGAVAKGVTISKYQNQAGPIDWDAMKADGVTFAMIRVGYLNDLDPYFKENMEGAISHGIRVGVFLYTMALDEETARQEAQFVLEQIRGYKISYPVAYDVESKYLLDNGKTPQELANQTNIFCKTIADAGYRPILYGNNQWLTNYVDVSQVPYDIWYARYGTSGDFQNRKIWQFTETGSVAGITGNVCIEASFYDYPELAAGNTGISAESGTYTAGAYVNAGPGVSLSAGQTQAALTVGASGDSQAGPSSQAGQQTQTSAAPISAAPIGATSTGAASTSEAPTGATSIGAAPTAGQDDSQLTKSPSEQ